MAGNPRRYVISYDIEDDRTRTRVAKLLGGVGWRVQKSVFECLVEPAALERLCRALGRELAQTGEGDIRVYRLCADCYADSFGLGEVAQGSGGEPWIIV